MILKHLDKIAFYNEILEYNKLPTDGLIAKWEFEDNLNDTLGTYDLSSASISYVTGKIGKAGSLNGTNSECYNTNVELRRIFDLQKTWSVNLWFYCTATNAGSYALFYCDGLNKSPYKRTLFYLIYDPGEIVYISIGRKGTVGDAGAYYYANRGYGNILLNVWNHISVNYTGTTILAYINGIEARPTTSPDFNFSIGDTDAHTTQTTIGGNAQNNIAQFKGYIDQVYLYNRALSFTEVNQVYNNGKGER